MPRSGGKYNEARQWFTTGVSADNGYALSEELTTRANTAANIITTGGNTLGADSGEVQAAQAALDDFSACLEAVQNGSKKQSLTSLPYYQGSAMHALCQANEALGTVIDQLYAKMQEQAADPMKMGAVQGQYGQFNSAGTIIGNLQYNDAVYEYQNDVAASRPVCWAGCSAYRRWNLRMKTMKRFAARICALFVVLTVSLTALVPAAFAATKAQLPDLPSSQCVVDDANILSSSTKTAIENLNAQLTQQCEGAQIGVLTVDYTGSLSTEDYAVQAANTWGLGSSSKNTVC